MKCMRLIIGEVGTRGREGGRERQTERLLMYGRTTNNQNKPRGTPQFSPAFPGV